MSDKKSMVPSIYIHLVFKKQVQVVPSAPRQVYNHFINKYEKNVPDVNSLFDNMGHFGKEGHINKLY